MRWWVITGYGLSVAVHFGLALGVTSIPKKTTREPTTVTMFQAKAEKKKAPEPEKAKPPEPPKPVVVPKQLLKVATAPPPMPDNSPPPPTTAAPPTGHAAMAALPDFGIALGGVSGGGGRAVPAGGGAAARVGAGAGGGAEKRPRAAAPKPSEFGDGCAEEATKPKSVDRAQPQYTDDARSANIEGVVSVEFRIGPDGQVVDARVVKGLGHGLDEAAVAAAKRWRFNPSTRCGKPVEAKHIVNMRFQLGD